MAAKQKAEDMKAKDTLTVRRLTSACACCRGPQATFLCLLSIALPPAVRVLCVCWSVPLPVLAVARLCRLLGGETSRPGATFPTEMITLLCR